MFAAGSLKAGRSSGRPFPTTADALRSTNGENANFVQDAILSITKAVHAVCSHLFVG